MLKGVKECFIYFNSTLNVYYRILKICNHFVRYKRKDIESRGLVIPADDYSVNIFMCTH